MKLPFASMSELACAMYLPSSSRARNHCASRRGRGPRSTAAVRRLDEAVLVHAGERGERRDEADVRTFRRLDRADTTVVRGVHVAHLEAGALTSETTRPERRQATLVRHFATAGSSDP